MFLLYIINIISISYRNFYDNIQDTIINKYKKKEFELIDLKERTLLINISLLNSGCVLKRRFIDEKCHSVSNELYFKYFLDINDNILILYNKNKYSIKRFISQIFRDELIDYEIIYNLSEYSILNKQKLVIETFIKDIKEYHKNDRLRIIRNTDLLISCFESDIKSSEIVCKNDDIIINFIFIRNNYLYCFNINYEEFNFKEYFLDILTNYEFSNLYDRKKLFLLFKDFKFSFYSFCYNNTYIHENFIKDTSKEQNEYDVTSNIFDKKFPYTFYEEHLNINGKNYFHCPLGNNNITEKMLLDNIKKFFSFSLNLKNNDLLSVSLLYYSMSDNMKMCIIDKIMKPYYSPYSIIYLILLENLQIITKNEFENLMSICFSLSSLNQDPNRKKFKIDYTELFERNIKKRILDLRPFPESIHFNYLMILFAKVHNEIYLSNHYNTEKYSWKKTYDKILHELHLPKNENSCFNIFKHVLLDLENVTYIIQYELTAIIEILAYFTKRPPLIYQDHDFTFKLNEYKEMLQNQNLEKLPIKQELIKIMK